MGGYLLWICFQKLLDGSVFIAGCIALFVTAFPVAQIIIGALYMYECPVAPAIPVYVVVCGILTLLLMTTFAFLKLVCPATSDSIFWKVWILSLVLFGVIWLIYGSYQVYSTYPPNYDKNLNDTSRINISIYSTALPPDNTQIHDQGLINLNRTLISNNNQTLMEKIQTLAFGTINSKTNREHQMAPRITAAVPYCDRTFYLFAFWTTTLVYVVTGNIVMMMICLVLCMKISIKFVELVFN